ncbi:flagellar biosynthesis anti-sigma factor FlgM [Roseateles terrae]|uniref:Negative regulator of flagellin synthesis n=1 Tax=Roseateles terrae TaxID=431060 RepID=A0ABR6GPU0_9BURK|nr:flagellar biosynthesis anti-sigma factor FlgM [Roseateles terrae]MBB3194120.1 negative regulator of flagellin synthesis FlgM [Roseateles terrae]OWQ87981.1 flagellar biosynthesis anti-sigma factor FlgM [Roseateles terrae]
MRVTSNGPLNPVTGAGGVAAETPVPAASASSPALQAAALESDALKPAQADLAAMPDVDEVKVAALRNALANGEIKFDANRLAQLIQRFHGGRA